MSKTYIELETDEIVKVTEEAVLVAMDGVKDWIPKSQIKNGIDLNYNAEGEVGVVLEIQEWWAIQEELI